MLDDLRNRAVPVPFRVFEQLAELAVGKPFPDHRHGRRRKGPIGRAGRHVKVGQIMILMAGTAFDGVDAVTIGAPPDVHNVGMAVVSLAREIAGGMTVHAARVAKDGNHGFESCG